MLIKEEIKSKFDRDGFLLCKKLFSPNEMAALLSEIKQSQRRYEIDTLTKGSMTFKSSVFFHNPEIQQFISQQKIIDILKEIIGSDIWVRWDQAVAKGPGSNTFPWHQDNNYSKLKDPHYQVWIALTESNANNGGLWLQPGSHKQKNLPYKKVGHEVVYDGTPENPILITAEPGDVVIFSSFTLHSTTPNITKSNRWAYVVEYMSLNHCDPYIEPPYFVVARDGKSNPEFVKSFGSKNNLSRIKYYISDLKNPRKVLNKIVRYRE